ncbi:hypothetical protein A2U01_0026295, partial [Trifolium medium]|nr:hypothetical protein [Trifolium medium]
LAFSTQPSAFPAQLDHELHLQHTQLCMFSSAQPSAFPAQHTQLNMFNSTHI